MRLGESLYKNGKITNAELQFCLDVHKNNPQDRFGEIVESYGLVSGWDIAQFNAQKVGWALFEGSYEPDWDVLDKVGLSFFQDNRIYPLGGYGRPTFVLAYIEMHKATDWLREQYGMGDVQFYVGIENQLRQELDQLALQDMRRKTGSDLVVIEDIANVESAVGWFDAMLQKAVLFGATDVHIEPCEKGVFVRFRIDGVLVSAYVLPASVGGTIANIALSRCAQNPSQFKNLLDGRFSFIYMDKRMDVRFAMVPMVTGPKIALRLLDPIAVPYSLKKIGYSDFNLELIKRAVELPHGIILVTGPTGCGKTTTNHSILNELKDISLNIMTAEDPVEIKNSGVSQLQINKDQNITFASALRSFLRQDPDIIMVGEIRDHETAAIAVQAAQTGHLLLSTLHTNDPAGAILRLQDLGVARINISSTLIAVISQRLLRKLCPYCKEARETSKEQEISLRAKYLSHDKQMVFEARGCRRCFGGFHGRTVVAEVLLINHRIRQLIDRDRVNEIPELLKDQDDYRTILMDARRLVLEGITSLEEAANTLG